MRDRQLESVCGPFNCCQPNTLLSDHIPCDHEPGHSPGLVIGLKPAAPSGLWRLRPLLCPSIHQYSTFSRSRNNIERQ